MNDAALSNPESRIPSPGAVRLRVAHESDAVQLCAAERETARIPGRLVSSPDEFDEAAFAKTINELAESGSYIVAERDGEIVGHAMLARAGTIRGLAHVRSLTIVVHPGYIGQGVGTALVHALQDWARATADVQRVELRVRETNTVALNLYKKCGFVEESRFKKRIKLPDGTLIDDIGMTWFASRTNGIQA